MTWVRIDDKAMQHPKLLQAGPEGVCLWLAGLCHCNGFATDGVIRKEFVDALYPPLGRRLARRIAAELVAIGLWIDDGTSFRVHDYEHYQAEAMKEVADAKAAALEARRKRDRERKRVDRAGKHDSVPDLSARTNGAGHNGHPPGPSEERHTDPPRVRASAGAPVSRPVPTRPERDQGSAQQNGVVGAVLDRGTAAAAAPNGSTRVSSRDAAIAWQRILEQVNPGAMHAHDVWQREFEVIATVCNAVNGKPDLALRVVVEWFWTAPDGPIAGGRIASSIASPRHLAKHISRDLDGALQWWLQRKQQQQTEPHEAAQ